MKFIYIGRVSYLMSDAASIRVHNVGAALRLKGHKVDYICQEGAVPGGRVEKDCGTCYGVFNEKSGKISMWVEWLFGNRAAKLLKKRLKVERYDGVILYNTPFTTSKRIMKLCRKHKMSVFGDVTEWYEIKWSKGPLACAYAWLVDRRIRFLDPNCDGIIAISPYLEEFYKEKVPTINLPPVFEGEGRCNTSKNKIPRFLYAGSPSKKDELFHFIQAMKEINNDGIRAELTIIGAPIPEDSEKLALKGIHYFPRMPREAILDTLGEHDFSVLFRREARYAKAGYSTKVAEALYNGTPVFCNEIGGADLDIQDGLNGIKIGFADTRTIKNALLRIIQIPSEEIAQMKKNAFNFGRKKYSRKNYEEALSEFMTDFGTKA